MRTIPAALLAVPLLISSLAIPAQAITPISANTTATNAIAATPKAAPSFELETDIVTSSWLENNGVLVSGLNFPANKNGTLTFEGGTAISVSTDSDGRFNQGVAEPGVAPGTYQLTAVIDGVQASTSIRVTAEASFTVTPDTLSVPELASTGVLVEGSNFPPNNFISADIDGVGASGLFSDDEGKISGYITSSQVPAGVHQLVLSTPVHRISLAQTLTITPGSLPAAPKVTLSSPSISASELYFTGTRITGTGFPANRPVNIILDHVGDDLGTAQSDAQGRISYLFKYEARPATTPLPLNLIFASGDLSTSATLTVTPSFGATLSPKTMSADALAQQGTTVTGTYFPVGAKITVTFDGKDPQVYTVDAHRNLSFLLKRAGVTPGTHQIGLTWLKWVPSSGAVAAPPGALGNDHLDLALTVTANATSTPNALIPASNTEELANSGSNAAPAGIGLLLIAAGAAAVLFSRRRKAPQA
ncbi:hypothetical protein [Psychromicrobium sp. YIM B11713]|uniref:hypothetical protein n=1 Tax=Psychromicrobium sp. YIM B11713 TaxID=3145233 RepID=UPI00374F9FEC